MWRRTSFWDGRSNQRSSYDVRRLCFGPTLRRWQRQGQGRPDSRSSSGSLASDGRLRFDDWEMSANRFEAAKRRLAPEQPVLWGQRGSIARDLRFGIARGGEPKR